MAIFRLCSIPDCGKPSLARDYCSAHYMRWKRHGDPRGGNTTPGDAGSHLETVLTYDGDECLIWPFGRTAAGYGVVWFDGKIRYVHRLACESSNGPAPTPKHEAAHSCGKGHEGCVTKGHLSWKTPRENTADKENHGTMLRGETHGSAKLTEVQARAVLALKGTMTQREIAAQFNVHPALVSAIHTGRAWRFL